MNPNFQRIMPGCIAGGLGAVFLLFMMVPPGDAADKMHLHEAGRLPVVQGGRVQPLDTVARHALMVISGRQEFVDAKGNRQPAVAWLFDVMVTKEGEGPAMSHKVFRIENDQVLSMLRLQSRPGSFRYSFDEIGPRYSVFLSEYDKVRRIAPKDRDLYAAKIFELGEKIHLFQELSQWEAPLTIPPTSSDSEWRSLKVAIGDIHKSKDAGAAKDFVELLMSYAKGDVKEFNAKLTGYEKFLEKSMPAEADKTDFETFFNHFAPFYQCAVLYVFVLILACVGWIAFPQQLSQAALALAVVTLVVHTFALFGRMYLMGRPLVFVTNLYSSAVFIGWICVITGLVLEWIFHNGLGCFIAGVLGAMTLVVGHFLSLTGDTLEMMQAVLDTNFWLATHVTSVTIGYSATFVAGFLGALFIALGVFTTKLDKVLYKSLATMIYGVICFAMVFSFVGTVLGGIWADQSWGRFWGWDPKENGALLIVLWNALILHARWGGLVQQRGMAVLAVGGNIITTWSWFGVNMLGVGLHSYGFTSSQLFWVLSFVGSQLVIIGIGLVPLSKWPSIVAAKLPPRAKPTPETPEALAPAPVGAITAAPGRRGSKHVKA